MNKLTTLILAALCGMPWHVNASGVKEWEVVGPGVKGRVVAMQVADIVGATGEHKLSVLHRAGMALVAYSASTGFEACAEICRAVTDEGERFGLTVTTAKSHLACPVLPVCPAGFEAVGENIHSHGSSRPYRINRADAALSHFAVGEMQRVPHNHFAFSGEDLGGRDGVWLARPDGLLEASGRGEGVQFHPATQTLLAASE